MSSDSGMDIRLHPLVILHVADQYTRSIQQNNQARVMGVLVGTQTGRVVNIIDALDVAFDFAGCEKTADMKENAKFTEALKTFDEDMKLFKLTFPSYDVLGWYATAGAIEPMHAAVHKQMKGVGNNDRPLLMMVDQKIDSKARDLPVNIFTEVIHVSGEKITAEFVSSPYKIESEEPERVTAVHCAKVISQVDTNTSTVVPHYSTVQQAVTTLNQRLKVVQNFLRDTQSGKIKTDHSILRAIKGLCNRLPAASAGDFRDGFLSEYNDSLLVSYLATITKSTALVNDVVDKFNTTFGQRRRGPMGMGMGMGGFF